MNEKKLILHIGSPKTGTTAIQNFLFYNHKKLAEKGIQYPGKFHKQSFMFYNLFNIQYPYLQKKISIAIKEIVEEINSADQKTVILSYEGLSCGIIKGYNLSGNKTPKNENIIQNLDDYVTFIDEEKISALKKFIDDNLNGITDVRIIYYCRRQDSFFESQYKELLKHNILFSSNDFKYLFPIIHECNHYSIVKTWTKIFGEGTVFVRPYESSQMLNGNVIDDFCSLVNIDVNCFDRILDDDSNISWNNYSAYLWRLMLVNDPSISVNWAKYNYIEKKVSELQFKDKIRYSLLSPEERLEILEGYDKSNSKLAKEFLNREDGILFQNKRPDVNEFWEEQILTSDEIVRSMASIYPEIFQWKLYARAKSIFSCFGECSVIKDKLYDFFMKFS